MKCQALFSLKKKKKKDGTSSAAVLISTLTGSNTLLYMNLLCLKGLDFIWKTDVLMDVRYIYSSRICIDASKNTGSCIKSIC